MDKSNQGGRAETRATEDCQINPSDFDVTQNDELRLYLENELARCREELLDCRRTIEEERNRVLALMSVAQSAALFARKPIINKLQINIAKAALKSLPWLSDRRREKLQRSIAKRDYSTLLSTVGAFSGEDVYSDGQRTEQFTLGQSRDFGEVSPPKAPSEAEWNALIPSGGILAPEPIVDVIVPVYRGYDETMRCLYSVINERQSTPFRLVVINDCSPDKKITRELRKLDQSGLILLLENECNVGFVLSCNRGMRMHPERDVILLNSDTEVYSNWLDRIMARASSDPRIGTLTPFSNNATICSYPNFCVDNNQELEVSGRMLDKIASNVCRTAEMAELPTAVGFCMYIRRSGLDQVGLFDEVNFGKGYGEENDLSRRLAKNGWKNMIVPDVFVRHWGAVSFGKNNLKRLKIAEKTIRQLHPTYHRDVADFIKSDPLKPLRERLDVGRLAFRAKGNAILFVTHDLGGGTEHHVQEMRRWIEDAGAQRVYICRPHPTLPECFYIEDPESAAIPNLRPAYWTDGTKRLEKIFLALGIRHIHVHHLIRHGRSAPGALRQLAQSGHIPVDFTVHDYFSICPRVNLIDGSGVYCGEPNVSACQACIDRNGSQVSGKVSVDQWREAHLRLLDAVRYLYAPSWDAAQRISSYLQREDIRVREHATDRGLISALREPIQLNLSSSKVRKIAVLGAIGPHKGSDLLFRTAEASLRLGLALEFVVIGYTDRDNAFRSLRNIQITGRYEPKALLERIHNLAPHLLWIPSVCPETFCYTLTEGVAAGVHPVVFDIGAQAGRLREIGWGTIMPRDLMTDPEGAARFLASCDITRPHPETRIALVREYANVEAYFG